MEELHAEADEPHVKIVRPSNRRKFLTVILGSGVILGLGVPPLVRLAQNVRVAFSAKNAPPNYSDLELHSFSPDLNLLAMAKYEYDGKLYIWNYQQQRMTTLPAPSLVGASAWSPNNRYLFFQERQTNSSISLNIWDIQTQQKVSSYTHEKYGAADIVCWSPDGSQIALYSQDQNKLLLMSARPLQPLFVLDVPPSIVTFTWSPDSRRIALLIDSPGQSAWKVAIWDIQSLRMSQELAFQGRPKDYGPCLAWSPDRAHIAALFQGQLQIIQVSNTISSYLLKESDYGKVCWSPDGKYLAIIDEKDFENFFVASPGSRFDVWDISERKVVRSYNRGMASVPKALGWAKDGRTIIVIGPLDVQENWDGV